METLGSILLHEFTHCEKLMNSGSLSQRHTGDKVYGPVSTRTEVAISDTTRNADRYEDTMSCSDCFTNRDSSFSWCANELFWTVACGAFEPPILVDEEDPYCGNKNCVAPDGWWKSIAYAENSTAVT